MIVAIAVLAMIFFKTSNAAGMLNLVTFGAIGYAIYSFVGIKKYKKEKKSNAEEFVKAHQEIDYFNTLIESTDMEGLYEYGSSFHTSGEA